MLIMSFARASWCSLAIHSIVLASSDSIGLYCILLVDAISSCTIDIEMIEWSERGRILEVE